MRDTLSLHIYMYIYIIHMCVCVSICIISNNIDIVIQQTEGSNRERTAVFLVTTMDFDCVEQVIEECLKVVNRIYVKCNENLKFNQANNYVNSVYIICIANIVLVQCISSLLTLLYSIHHHLLSDFFFNIRYSKLSICSTVVLTYLNHLLNKKYDRSFFTSFFIFRLSFYQHTLHRGMTLVI